MEEVIEDLGPAMRALSPLRQAFVRAVIERPLVAKREDWARAAGYGGAEGTAALRVQAHRLMHDDRILAAIQEETWKQVKLGGAIGIAGLMRMARNPKDRGHRQACEALADRAGFSAVQKVDVKHEHVDMTGDAVRREIERLAAKVGIEPAKLLGGNVIEGEFTEVRDAQGD